VNTMAAMVPDLLRRFASTQYHSRFSNDAVVTLATNNKHLLAEFEARSEQIGEAFRTFGAGWVWRLIQDEDAPYDSDEPTILDAGSITMLFLGTGTMVAVDWIRREVLGFAATDVSSGRLFKLIIGIAEVHDPFPSIQAAGQSLLKRSTV